MDIQALCENFDVNNLPQMIFLSGIIFYAVACVIKQFSSSRLEILLMGKKELKIRLCMKFVIFYIIFLLVNLSLGNKITYTGFEIILLILCVFIRIIGSLIENIKKKKNSERNTEFFERTNIIILLIIGPISSYTIGVISEINYASCAVIVAIIQGIIFFVLFPELSLDKADFFISLNGEKWYICQKMDDALLCRNEKDINKSEEFKIILFQTIADKEYIIVKDIIKPGNK